jgi:hypothetical protein
MSTGSLTGPQNGGEDEGESQLFYVTVCESVDPWDALLWLECDLFDSRILNVPERGSPLIHTDW